MLRPVVIKSAEARRELAKAWPAWAVDFLKASAEHFGIAEEIVVMDQPTIEHMHNWKRQQDQAQKNATRPTAQAEIAKQRKSLRG